MERGKIKLIVFDFNGMLTKLSYRHLARYIAKKYHLSFDQVYDVLYHKYFNQAALKQIGELEFYDKTRQELHLEESARKLQQIHLAKNKLNKSVFDYGLSLMKRGYTVVLLSKNIPHQFKVEVRSLNVHKYYPYIVNTSELGLPKASRQTMRYLLKKYHAKPKQTVIIDDQNFNLPPAKQMGIHTIHYKNFQDFKKKLEKIIS